MKTSEADRVLDSNDMLCIAVWFISSHLRRKHLIIGKAENCFHNLMELIC